MADRGRSYPVGEEKNARRILVLFSFEGECKWTAGDCPVTTPVRSYRKFFCFSSTWRVSRFSRHLPLIF